MPGIIRAREMGLRVVVSDMDPDAPGLSLSDDALLASTYDVEKTIAVAKAYHTKKYPISGVICIATDVPRTVASVAKALDLPGIPIRSACLAMDKLAMKERFSMDHVPVPWYRPVSSPLELSKIVREKGLPLVIKPVDSRGARGVLRLTSGVDLTWAFETALKYSPTGRVMVETFLEGPQVSTESMVIDGKVFTPGFSDRNYEYLDRYSPHIIENGGELPSFLSKEVQASVRDIVSRAAHSLGIVNGVVKGDIVVHKDQPYVIELAARLSGGYFCTHEIPLNTGVDFVGAAIQMAMGEKPSSKDLVPRFQRAVVQRYLFPSTGTVVRISGVNQVASRPGIALCEVRTRVGEIIKPVDSHPARAGVVIATGNDRQTALERAKSAIADIHVQTCPVGA